LKIASVSKPFAVTSPSDILTVNSDEKPHRYFVATVVATANGDGVVKTHLDSVLHNYCTCYGIPMEMRVA